MKLKCFFLSFIMVFLLATTVRASDDFQYWSQYIVKVIDTEKIDWSIYTEGGLYNDAGDVGLYLVSPKISYDFWKYLNLGTNYTYINYKSSNAVAGRSELKFQHRAELEINPHWDIGDFVKIHNRNRIEFRWIEDKGSYNTRSRHRIAFTFPREKGAFLENIFMNTEVFYNWAEHQYDENRTVPLGLSFKVSDKASFKTFYMIQTKNGGDDWSANQVFGTLLALKF